MLCLRLTLMRDMDTGIVSEPSANIGLEEDRFTKSKTIHVSDKQAKSINQTGGKTLNLMAGRNTVQPFQANVPFPIAAQQGSCRPVYSDDEEHEEEETTPMQKLRRQYSYKKWR